MPEVVTQSRSQMPGPYVYSIRLDARVSISANDMRKTGPIAASRFGRFGIFSRATRLVWARPPELNEGDVDTVNEGAGVRDGIILDDALNDPVLECMNAAK